MRKYYILFVAFVFGLSLTGISQTVLVVEVRTDNNPDETSWVLYDVTGNIVEESIPFEKETTYRDTIILDDAICNYWTIYDSYGDGLNGGINPGDFNIYLNGVLVAELDNPDFGDSTSVYNLGLACSPNDVGVLNMAMLKYLSKDKEAISANILNMGVEPITNIEIFYKVNDFTSNKVVVSGLDIAVGQKIKVSYPELHDFTQPGSYNIEFTVTKVNGQADGNDINNTVTHNAEVLNGFVRYNVIEDFGSFACGPCYDADVKIEGTIGNYPGNQSYIKYMTWKNSDTKYFSDVEDLLGYYSVRGIPHILISGEKVEWLSFTPVFYEDYLGLVSPMKITLNGEMRGDSLMTTIKVFSNETLSEPMVLRIMVMENESYDLSLDMENRYPYSEVVYAMVNGIDGIGIDNINAGETLEFTTTTSIVDYPFEDGSLDDMAVLAYVQNIQTKEIFQSKKENISYYAIEPTLSYNIENGSVDVDTTGLEVVVTSDRILYDFDGASISNPGNNVKVMKNTADGSPVPANVTINDMSNKITIQTQYGWDKNGKYFIVSSGFTTLDGFVVPNDTLIFTTSGYTGLFDKNKNTFIVYPNPVEEYINIDTETAAEVVVSTISGSIVKQYVVAAGATGVDVSNLKTGLYIIRVKTVNEIRVGKFFIK